MTENPSGDKMTTPPCTECAHCTGKVGDQTTGVYYYCTFEEGWISAEYAESDIECDAFVQKLDDNETKE